MYGYVYYGIIIIHLIEDITQHFLLLQIVTKNANVTKKYNDVTIHN